MKVTFEEFCENMRIAAARKRKTLASMRKTKIRTRPEKRWAEKDPEPEEVDLKIIEIED
jgi:hypothetical protein